MLEVGQPLLQSSSAAVLWMLARNPETQESLAAEVSRADAAHGSASGSMRALASLQGCSGFLKETLRLLPPLTQCVSRVAVEEVRIAGRLFSPGVRSERVARAHET